jgi:hypothetical protein
VLVHLAARDAVVARLVEALKTGGWLVVEDFDSALPHCLDPLNDDEHTFAKVGKALVAAVHQRGGDTTYPRTLPHRFRAAGLIEIGASGHLFFYQGGSPQSMLHQANIDQVGQRMVDAGLVTAEETATYRRLLDDPSFVGNHPLLITAWGRKPGREPVPNG